MVDSRLRGNEGLVEMNGKFINGSNKTKKNSCYSFIRGIRD
jgi:hypothetical protein